MLLVAHVTICFSRHNEFSSGKATDSPLFTALKTNYLSRYFPPVQHISRGNHTFCQGFDE